MANSVLPMNVPFLCEDCDHYAWTGHDCHPVGSGHCNCAAVDWKFTTPKEFPVDEDDTCVFVDMGDDCACHSCTRHAVEKERAATETYWRNRLASSGGGYDPNVLPITVEDYRYLMTAFGFSLEQTRSHFGVSDDAFETAVAVYARLFHDGVARGWVTEDGELPFDIVND